MRTGRGPRFVSHVAFGVLALLAAAGCGRTTGDVSGVVTLEGRPLPRGRVTFLSQTVNKNCYTISGSDGSYTITKCPVGPAVVTVETFRVSPRGQNKKREDRARLAKKGWSPEATPDPVYVPIPDRYRDTAKSGLTYTVRSGSQKHNLELTSK